MRRSLTAAAASALALALMADCVGSIGSERVEREGPSGDPGGDGRTGSDGGTTTIPPDPGRVVMHRLNEIEYNNTIQQVLGTAQMVTDGLQKESAFGFDNNAAVLRTSSNYVDRHQAAAEALVEEALAAGNPRRAQILKCDPDTGGASCARDLIRSFLRRAWRRPATDAQVDRLLRFIDVAAAEGEPPLRGIKLALAAALTSPRFLFRVEPDPSPLPAEPWALDDYSIASRLSYFLHSTMPDDALLAAADAGQLHDEASLRIHVRRLLRDAKAQALAANFAGQWLYIRDIKEHKPAGSVLASYDEGLAQSLASGMELFFRDLVAQRRPVEELVTADWARIDARLAAHMEMPFTGSGFRQMPAPVGRRAGILAQPGLLMVTSELDRTSPTKRGAWILGNLLCSPPPPPPDTKVARIEQQPATPGRTFRQRLEDHRRDPGCAGCHSSMDPVGFGLESFDAVGRWRTQDNGRALDTTGVLPDGRAFKSAEELGRILAADARFVPCVVKKLLTYAVGRGFESVDDGRSIAALTDEVLRGDHSLGATVEAVATSSPFRMRGPETKGAP